MCAINFLFLLCGLFIFVLLGLDGHVKFVKTCVITNSLDCRKSWAVTIIVRLYPTRQHILLLLLDLFSVIVEIHTLYGLKKSVSSCLNVLILGEHKRSSYEWFQKSANKKYWVRWPAWRSKDKLFPIFTGQN